MMRSPRATCQESRPARSVAVRNCGEPIAADPPGGWGGWGLGKPDRTVWPTARLSVAGTPVTTYDDGFPKAPPRPPPPRCSRSDRRLQWRGSRARPEESACPQPSDDRLEVGRDRRSIPRASFDARLRARATRAGRERRVGLRKPVVVRSDRRTAYRHSGGRLDGPIGFPQAHPSLPPGERAVRVRTETLPDMAVARRISPGSRRGRGTRRGPEGSCTGDARAGSRPESPVPISRRGAGAEALVCLPR